jgi:hypothetical protein
LPVENLLYGVLRLLGSCRGIVGPRRGTARAWFRSLTTTMGFARALAAKPWRQCNGPVFLHQARAPGPCWSGAHFTIEYGKLGRRSRHLIRQPAPAVDRVLERSRHARNCPLSELGKLEEAGSLICPLLAGRRIGNRHGKRFKRPTEGAFEQLSCYLLDVVLPIRPIPTTYSR